MPHHVQTLCPADISTVFSSISFVYSLYTVCNIKSETNSNNETFDFCGDREEDRVALFGDTDFVLLRLGGVRYIDLHDAALCFVGDVEETSMLNLLSKLDFGENDPIETDRRLRFAENPLFSLPDILS